MKKNKIALMGIFNILAAVTLFSGISSFNILNNSPITVKNNTKIENKDSKISLCENECLRFAIPCEKTKRKGDKEFQKNRQSLTHENINQVFVKPEKFFFDKVVTNNFCDFFMLFINPTTVLDADANIELQFQMEQMVNKQIELLFLSDAMMNDDFYTNQYVYDYPSTYIVSDSIINRYFQIEITK